MRWGVLALAAVSEGAEASTICSTGFAVMPAALPERSRVPTTASWPVAASLWTLRRAGASGPLPPANLKIPLGW